MEWAADRCVFFDQTSLEGKLKVRGVLALGVNPSVTDS